jgi:uncharacterized protein (TIGR03437 family)
LRVREVINAVTLDHRFPRRGRQAFLAILVEGLSDQVTREAVRVEVGGFGINPIFVGRSGDPRYAGWTQINAPVPPGLAAGAVAVRVLSEGRRSNEAEILLVEGGEW